MASPLICFNTEFILEHIAFALKRIGKLYYQWQHFVIVQNNHFAETGFTPVNDGFIHKRSRRQPPVKRSKLNHKIKIYIFNLPVNQKHYLENVFIPSTVTHGLALSLQYYCCRKIPFPITHLRLIFLSNGKTKQSAALRDCIRQSYR